MYFCNRPFASCMRVYCVIAITSRRERPATHPRCRDLSITKIQIIINSLINGWKLPLYRTTCEIVIYFLFIYNSLNFWFRIFLHMFTRLFRLRIANNIKMGFVTTISSNFKCIYYITIIIDNLFRQKKQTQFNFFKVNFKSKPIYLFIFYLWPKD